MAEQPTIRLTPKERKAEKERQNAELKNALVAAHKKSVLRSELVHAAFMRNIYLKHETVKLMCNGFREDYLAINEEYEYKKPVVDGRPQECLYCTSPCGKYFDYTEAKLCFIREVNGIRTPSADEVKKYFKKPESDEDIEKRVSERVDAVVAVREAAFLQDLKIREQQAELTKKLFESHKSK
jgi:hypothetical protein